jgi:hypothetical protein
MRCDSADRIGPATCFGNDVASPEVFNLRAQPGARERFIVNDYDTHTKRLGLRRYRHGHAIRAVVGTDLESAAAPELRTQTLPHVLLRQPIAVLMRRCRGGHRIDDRDVDSPIQRVRGNRDHATLAQGFDTMVNRILDQGLQCQRRDARGGRQFTQVPLRLQALPKTLRFEVEIPKAWQIAFEAAKLGDYPPSFSKQPEDDRPFKELLPTVTWRRPLVVQELILGIHAHINYDLPLTLNQLGFDPRSEAHQHDHNEINMIIAEAVDAIQNFIISHYSPVFSVIDTALGNLDEIITCWTFSKAREHAWNYAVILNSNPSAHREILNQMDDNAAVLARMILNPFGLSWILDMIRWVEDFKMKPKGQDQIIKWTNIVEEVATLDLQAWRTKK